MSEINLAMITFNGAEHVAAQLESLAQQTRLPRALYVSDDGSRDETLLRVKAFARRAPFPVHLFQGPGNGPAHNMMSLLARMPSGPTGMVDQDDIWFSNRLADAEEILLRQDDGRPAIHVCARLIRRPNTVSRPLPAPGFATALVQNCAAGNATIMNAAALSLMQDAAARVGPLVPFHDWLLFQLVTGVGGRFLADMRPGLFYRDHGGNVLGQSATLAGVCRRARLLMSGQARRWIEAQAHALRDSGVVLQSSNRRLLDQVLTDIHSGTCPIRAPIRRTSALKTRLLAACWHVGRGRKGIRSA